jgi:predicted nuclease of predicted toxin-antitoxin system
VKLFIDECLSPVLAARLNDSGLHDALHPRDHGRLGEPDHLVLRRCLDEDRTIVTENARDFRQLLGDVEIHPGLIVLPSVGRERSWALLEIAITAIRQRGDPDQLMINRVVEIGMDGGVIFYDLPAPA